MAVPEAPFPALAERLGDDARWILEAAARGRAERRELAVLFPQLPRRLGRAALDPSGGGAPVPVGPGRCDLSAWRRCDAGAALLLAAASAPGDELRDLYAHGDLEERTMLLRALAVLPVGPATGELLGEVQRTNLVLHVEAAVCDSDLLRRTAQDPGAPAFGRIEANSMLLKLAFLDLPLGRAFDAGQLANPELSRMLQDLATEREAAGRPIWRDTDRLLCRAPIAGSVARILGGLEHGDDGRRLAAAEALVVLGRTDLRPFAQERLEREPRAQVRALLQEFVG